MKTVIIANGELQERPILAKDVTLICADGGAEHAKKFELLPHYIIGDFDSVSAETLEYFREKEVEIIHESEQDSTDLQKALRLAQKLGASEIEIYGAIGKDLDHTIGNLLCLSQVPSTIRVVLHGKKETIYRICDNFKLELEPEALVSVIALTSVKELSYKGLKWLVKGLDVEQNWLGTRNRATGPVEISLEEGQVLVIIKE